MQQYNDKVINQARKTRGYLFKHSSGLISIWQRRYFIIIDSSLCYYADETLQEAKKSINLNQINYIKEVEVLEFHLVTKKRIYELKADDEPTRDLWVASLNILINYKQWVKQQSKAQNRSTDKKLGVSRGGSKTKKTQSLSYSPPSLSKVSSISMNSSRRLQQQFSAQLFLQRVCLLKLSQRWRSQQIRNKIILLKQLGGCYFIVSCKTLLRSHEDEDFLSGEYIYPYDFNCLYYYEFGRLDNAEVVEICKCSEIVSVEEFPKRIVIGLQNRNVEVELDYKKMEIVDVLSLVKKIRHAIKIGCQYYNSRNIKIKRNIDRMVYRYESKEVEMAEIVRKEIEKCCGESKEGSVRGQFRKSLQGLKKALKEIMDCCDAKGELAQQFKQKFVRQFHDGCCVYVQKMWFSNQKVLSVGEQKKILLLLFDFWGLIEDVLKESRLFDVLLLIHKNLMQKYREQILSKIDSCFGLKEVQILDEVKIEIKGNSEIIDKLQTVFYSNNIYRQFHVDIRLVLYEFPQMPVDDKVLQEYFGFFSQTFRYITGQTVKYLDKWKNVNLLLGTCNQIQFIKNSLFEQMYAKMTKQYPLIKKMMRDKFLKELQAQMSSTEIVLVKNLFVLTFSTLDKGLLSKSFDELNVNSICEQIIQKLKMFNKINKYVKRNIFQASFQEICYFYYTNIIKFHRKNHQKTNTAEFFVKKLTDDIKAIGKYFQSFIYQQKIYTHLKDLTLLKQFVHTDLGQIKKICQHLKKQFGNSFTEVAVINLLSLRDMSEEMRQNLAQQCSEIVKNSADTPEQISLMSSNRQSFFQNWNNSRSRKSTLTLSLNEFYENQYSIHQSKYNCTVWKQGYLIRRKFVKNVGSAQVKAFFKINRSQLEQYQTEKQQSPHTVYELQNVRKCYMHPQKNYCFVLDMHDCKLQFKAETSDEAREWMKHIFDDINVENRLKESPTQKERTSDNIMQAVKQLMKDPSTMDSYQKTLRSLQKSASCSPKINKKSKQQPLIIKQQSLQKPFKSSKEIKAKEDMDDNCLKCSKGFLF